MLLMATGILNAQDTIRTLLITEFRGDDSRENYVEITNVGATTLNLADFQIGTVSPWSTPIEKGNLYKAWNLIGNVPWPFTVALRLPEKQLGPGKSFIIAAVYDWFPEAYYRGDPKGNRYMNKKEFWTLADIQAHFPENPKQPDPTDSVNIWHRLLDQWNGAYGVYLAQYLSPTDSVVIDLVNAYEWDADGSRDESPHDVAGITRATVTSTLIRKFSVKEGNLDFLSAAGLDYTDSEWIPIPHLRGSWEMTRSLFWTAGNHGDYNLNEATLTSNTVDINWTDHVLTVPWGVRRDDSIMYQFDHKPGLAWHFDYAPSSVDSAFYSLRTGDAITIYACGNDVDIITFDIVVTPPTAGENRVVPKKMTNSNGFYYLDPPSWVVTDKIPVMDTIQEIPFGIRSDTLLKYLEKAPEANWVFEWADGKVRTDLVTGDILKVTAKNGTVKKYYIKTDRVQKSHNAYLASITWPDIPEFYKGLYGWVGDTIPTFSNSKTEYILPVPLDVEGIPALVGKTQNLNAKLEVGRAKNLFGSVDDKTVTFNVTAQDDTTTLTYTVQLEKEKDLSNVQPWVGKPFISQFVWKNDYNHTFLEIANPGTEPLDLSNYMIVSGYAANPAEAIAQNAATDTWGDARYRKYIPGYKWVTLDEWAVTPGIALPDVNIDPIVQAGDVFALGQVYWNAGTGSIPDFIKPQLDLDLANNPWGDVISQWGALEMWFGKIYLFEILNDSVKSGLKPATDPNDFQVLDCFADNAGQWTVGGIPAGQCYGYTRKPEVYQGNPVIGGSFGTTEEDSEWIMINESRLQALGYPWPNWRSHTCEGIGSHFMKAYTGYMSTVASNAYKVTPGFSNAEEIRGVVAGTTVTDFLAKIAKTHVDQTLTVKRAGVAVALDAAVLNGDVLEVVSPDAANTTLYILEVTAGGLSSDAVLTSADYTININGAEATITGFDYNVSLRTLVDNVVVPDGAIFSVIDGNNAYVPFMFLNYDTLMVNVMVNSDISFEVVAENGITTIVYQLMPNTMNSGAFVTSNVFDVDQAASLISNIPNGSGVFGLMKYIVPAPGSTAKVIDKLGFERATGNIYVDDRILVTSEDGQTTKIYFLQVLRKISNYLAYVLSDTYTVNQIEYSITGGNVTNSTKVSDFLANLTPCAGATLKVTNASGVEQTNYMAAGDLLVVSAGDGLTTVTYSLEVGTIGVQNISSGISVYPNPSSGLVYVSGLESGHRVFVTNMLGQKIVDRVVTQNTETINFAGRSAGIYFVTVNNGNQVVGRYKLVLQ